jgi:hypothetical protein
VARRRAREQLERLVVRDGVALEDAAVAVLRVLAEAYVGQQGQAGDLGAKRTKRRWTIPSSSQAPDPSASFVLRDAEQEHRADAGARELGGLADDLVDRSLGDARKPATGRTTPSPGQANSGITTSSSESARLAHERAQRVGATQPP